MKKILALALFLCLTISAFAVPTCTNPIIDGKVTPLELTTNIGTFYIENLPIGPVKFSCELDGMGTGETYHFVTFAYEDNPMPTKGEKIDWETKKIKKANGKEIEFIARKENKEKDTTLLYEHKVWKASKPLTENDNNTTIELVWEDLIGDQPGFEGVGALAPHIYMGLCTDLNNIDTCIEVKKEEYAYITHAINYGFHYTTYEGLLKFWYATTHNYELEMYFIKNSDRYWTLTEEEKRYGDLSDLLGDDLIIPKIDFGMITPPTDGKMYDYNFEDQFEGLENGGNYHVVSRYDLEGDMMSSKGNPYISAPLRDFEYSWWVGVDEIKQEVFSVLDNGRQIKVPSGYNGSTLHIHNMLGQEVETKKLNEGINEISNKTKGTLTYTVTDKNKKVFSTKVRK
ncbi:MAG: hypothetical protein HOF38_05250 [Elusimicrobiaceae bacterium]|jgi:hypothetical protein|nr:hypothetical protein [Elusimicrobiaceae bacterium]MBT4008169.1 hypothetical protein [Elusimicrobiaceae bacterium]MBT4402531.1 hypothetical protein [Elusimicrobiaceae bacterium]MBT4439658.1 hypothetical protein [Elusimicrobiaceae bacterium]MBT5988048.1 hypothetical protein [Elusimicrobiaceae bacterium]